MPMTTNDYSRRDVLAATVAVAAIGSIPGRIEAQAALGREMVRLWPGRPPGAAATPPQLKVDDQGKEAAEPDRGVTGVADPWLDVRRPANANGAAMLVIPGGGYVTESYDNEGTRQANWLNERGVTAFILGYRLPAEGWTQRRDVPLQDAQRAMCLIRRDAVRFGVMPDRVGVLGFSAGGHLAGSLATRFDERVYPRIDAADDLPARPALAALIYPVITMCPPLTHQGSHDALLGANADPATCARYSVDRRVTVATPPVFLTHAQDDDVVPVQNSILMYQAMLAAKRPVAMHLFEAGGHGFGTHLPPEKPASAWPVLLTAFMKAQGLTGA